MTQIHPAPEGTASDAVLQEALPRTEWANGSAMMRDYYDHEWGLPVISEAGLYERVCLEGFQAGLSWATILARRDAFRRAFAAFDPEAVAEFSDDDVERLVEDASIIRSRPKILAAIGNARATLELRGAPDADPLTRGFILPLWGGGELEIADGLPALIWSHAPKVTPLPESIAEVPTQSTESQALSKDLKERGFRFVGPTTAYALMEAVGIVDTHWVGSHKRGASRIYSPEGQRREFEPLI
ncbi:MULTISPECIES: DNA-3-methyladenine glycosylase I [Micrococcaceae]|uniref:DNA-3-methyladenine glycosylase I n=1 Tax=unclassified Kocuria TaxID=2649579 RepID=UPI001010FC20|nr:MULTISPECIES: DNA-3-methyladenine glycosylase I [unclassified Kocuria]